MGKLISPTEADAKRIQNKEDIARHEKYLEEQRLELCRKVVRVWFIETVTSRDRPIKLSKGKFLRQVYKQMFLEEDYYTNLDWKDCIPELEDNRSPYWWTLSENIELLLQELGREAFESGWYISQVGGFFFTTITIEALNGKSK